MLKFWVFWAGLAEAYIVTTLLLMDLYLFMPVYVVVLCGSP